MKTALAIAVLAASILPGLALADCRGDAPGQTAASCMPGMVWNAATGTCIDKPTS